MESAVMVLERDDGTVAAARLLGERNRLGWDELSIIFGGVLSVFRLLNSLEVEEGEAIEEVVYIGNKDLQVRW